MRNLFIFCLILFPSCFECRNDDCPSEAYFSFDIIDIESNTSLLQVPSQRYNFDSLSVNATTNQGTDNVEVFWIASNVFIPLSDEYESLIISFGSNEKDTLSIVNKTFSQGDDCCESVFNGYSLTSDGNVFCLDCEYFFWSKTP